MIDHFPTSGHFELALWVRDTRLNLLPPPPPPSSIHPSSLAPNKFLKNLKNVRE